MDLMCFLKAEVIFECTAFCIVFPGPETESPEDAPETVPPASLDTVPPASLDTMPPEILVEIVKLVEAGRSKRRDPGGMP
jgi:hypothetical protein